MKNLYGIILVLGLVFVSQVSFAQSKPYFNSPTKNETLKKHKNTDASHRAKKQYYKPSTRTQLSDANMLILEYGKTINNKQFKENRIAQKYKNDTMHIYKKTKDIEKYTSKKGIKVVIVIQKK